MNSVVKSWDMLKEYNSELKVMLVQDWLTFSTNVYVLQDFATKWGETLKASFSKAVLHISNFEKS